MAPTDMSDKEVEASLSLLGMMAPRADEDKAEVKTEEVVKPAQSLTGGGNRLHDSLMRAVATETAEQLESRRHAQLSSLSRELTLEELRAHFGKPIVQVAKEFGICTTFLKKICRRCGIKRWPHRQIRSLARTIHMLRQLEAQAESPQDRAKYAAQVAQMEVKQRAVFENPDENGKLKRVKKFSAPSSGKSSTTSSSSGASDQQDDDSMDDESGGGPNQCSVLMAAASVISASASYNVEPDAGGQDPTTKPLPSLGVVSPQPKPPAPAGEPGQYTTPVHSAGHPLVVSPPPVVMISPSNRKLTFLVKEDAEQRLRSASIGSLQGEDEQQQPVAV
jgi:hypothetical protein